MPMLYPATLPFRVDGVKLDSVVLSRILIWSFVITAFSCDANYGNIRGHPSCFINSRVTASRCAGDHILDAGRGNSARRLDQVREFGPPIPDYLRDEMVTDISQLARFEYVCRLNYPRA